MIAIEKISDLKTSIDMTNRTEEATARLKLLREMPMTDEERDLITGLEPLMRGVLELPNSACLMETFGLTSTDQKSRIRELTIYCQAQAHLQMVLVTSDDQSFRHPQIEQAVKVYGNCTHRIVSRMLSPRHPFWKRYYKRTGSLSQMTEVPDLTSVDAAIGYTRAHSGMLLVPLDLIHELSGKGEQLTYEIMQQVITMVQAAHTSRRAGGPSIEQNAVVQRASRMAVHLKLPWLDMWLAQNIESLNNEIS